MSARQQTYKPQYDKIADKTSPLVSSIHWCTGDARNLTWNVCRKVLTIKCFVDCAHCTPPGSYLQTILLTGGNGSQVIGKPHFKCNKQYQEEGGIRLSHFLLTQSFNPFCVKYEIKFSIRTIEFLLISRIFHQKIQEGKSNLV